MAAREPFVLVGTTPAKGLRNVQQNRLMPAYLYTKMVCGIEWISYP